MKLTCWDPNKQKIFEKLRDTGPLSRQNRVAVKSIKSLVYVFYVMFYSNFFTTK